MAITKIPEIIGPSYGGTIYGLSLSAGFSKEPSKLTLNIVSPDGTYETPKLGGNSNTTITFGSFQFVGSPWSYSINESANERTLQVEFIDGSVILDRYYVLLWKKGFFGNLGSKYNNSKTFDLTDIEYLVPVVQNGVIRFKIENLGIETIFGTSNEAEGQSGNVLYLGREEFKDSECTVPSTYYNLDQLKKISPVDINFEAPQNYRQTHEGTLREVIGQWCNDAGYDFYWDYSENRIKYYKVSDGISNLSDVNPSSNSTIIEKSLSESLEGTFAQVGFAYVIHPKEPIKSLLGTAKFSISVGINPYSIGYFFSKNGTAQSVSDRESWGRRNSDEMLTAGFLGYINQSLRNIWTLYEGFFFAGGYNTSTAEKIGSSQKASVINALKSAGYEENISALEEIDEEGLPNYEVYYVDYDEGWLNTFQQIEQEAIQFLGKYYQHAGQSGKFFYCSNTSIIEIVVTVKPEATYVEEFSEDVNNFKNRKLFIRQGTMSHDAQSAAEAIGLNEELIGKLEKLQAWHYEFSNGPLQGIKTDRNSIAFIPTQELVDKQLPRFSIDSQGGQNPREATVNQLLNASQADPENNCAPFDERYKKGSCQSARERAEQQARDKKIPKQKPQKELIDGLLNNNGRGVSINLGSGRLNLRGPADGQYQVIYDYVINANFLKDGEIETIKWEGVGVSANNVGRLDVIEDNVTDPTFDDFGKPRNQSLPKAVNIINDIKQKSIKYVFAGQPTGLIMSPSNGLSALDVSLSEDGFKTTATFATRPKQRTPVDSFIRKVNSQINRTSINAT